MGVMAYIRQVYIDAAYYKQARQDYASRANGTKRPAYDRALEGVLESPRILLPAVRAVEIERMLQFSSELKTPAVLYGGHEAYREADLLRKAGTPVLVSLKWPERARDADPERTDSLRTLELREQAPSTPAALAKAGVPLRVLHGRRHRPRPPARREARARRRASRRPTRCARSRSARRKSTAWPTAWAASRKARSPISW